jgi:hypothetical protein
VIDDLQRRNGTLEAESEKTVAALREEIRSLSRQNEVERKSFTESQQSSESLAGELLKLQERSTLESDLLSTKT